MNDLIALSVLSRLQPLNYEQAVISWTGNTEAKDEDDDEVKEESLINRQACNQEGEVQVNLTQEDGSED
jgi:hypothetical protein